MTDKCEEIKKVVDKMRTSMTDEEFIDAVGQEVYETFYYMTAEQLCEAMSKLKHGPIAEALKGKI